MKVIGPIKVGTVTSPDTRRSVGLIKSWPADRVIGVAVQFRRDRFWACFVERDSGRALV